MTPLPSTPAEWAAIVPNERDEEVVREWDRWTRSVGSWRGVIQCRRIAAASRIAEHERTREEDIRKFAEWIEREDGCMRPFEAYEAKVRRILGDR